MPPTQASMEPDSHFILRFERDDPRVLEGDLYPRVEVEFVGGQSRETIARSLFRYIPGDRDAIHRLAVFKWFAMSAARFHKKLFVDLTDPIHPVIYDAKTGTPRSMTPEEIRRY